ncbi:MAG: hypothetical protein PWQ17_2625, partial [Anaerophaga sp.]|nr:hypothetical protein [Anaerophaga sp.]
VGFRFRKNPKNVAPVKTEIKLRGQSISETLKPMSFYVIEMDAKF